MPPIDFLYKCDLFVRHQSLDSSEVAHRFEGLRVVERCSVGEPHGKHKRIAASTLVRIELTNNEFLDNEKHPLSEFILDRLMTLTNYRRSLEQLVADGTLDFEVAVFADSSNIAFSIPPAVSQKLAEMGIRIWFDYYAPENE